MAITNRLFTYSTTPIPGASQSGNLIISNNYISGYTWWGGPDENVGYVIAYPDTNVGMRTERNKAAVIQVNSVGFRRTSTKSDDEFITLFNGFFNQNYGSASVAAYWLRINGYWTSYTPEQVLISKSFIGGGSFSTYNGSSANGFVKLNIDGTIDNTFSAGTGFDLSNNQDAVLAISVQNDGKILVGGVFTSYNGVQTESIVRLNGDGTLDNTFNPTFSQNVESIISIKVQPDGKILVGGGFNFYYPDIYDANKIQIKSITRLNSDGTFDITFAENFEAYEQTLLNNNPPKSNGVVYDIALRPDGKIIAIGLQGKPENYTPDIGILNSDGSIDSSTTTKIYPTEGNIFTIALQPDGKILMGGSFITYGSGTPGVFYNRNRLVRLNSDLTLDDTFYTGAVGSNPNDYYYTYGSTSHGFDVTVQKVILQYDGKILAGGNFTTYKGITSSGIIRLNSDGSIDTTFNIGTGFARNGFSSGDVYDLKIQDDGKIIAVGYFNSYNGTSCNGIVRLNSDGSVDSGFTIGSGLNFSPGYPPMTIS